jgi:hypothetical protein
MASDQELVGIIKSLVAKEQDLNKLVALIDKIYAESFLGHNTENTAEYKIYLLGSLIKTLKESRETAEKHDANA